MIQQLIKRTSVAFALLLVTACATTNKTQETQNGEIIDVNQPLNNPSSLEKTNRELRATINKITVRRNE